MRVAEDTAFVVPPSPRYRLLMTAQVFDLGQTLRASERRAWKETFQFLTDTPLCEGDYQERNQDGRLVEVLLRGNFLFTFWADHAVKEVRIVQVDHA